MTNLIEGKWLSKEPGLVPSKARIEHHVRRHLLENDYFVAPNLLYS
jgi:hypothetical protein